MVYPSNTTKSAILVHIDTASTQNIQFLGGNKSNIKISLTDGGITIPSHSGSRCLLSLYSACIPISFYNIRNDNNTFILQEGMFQMNITIPNGNYTSKSLAFTVLALLNSASYFGNTYTMTYSTISNKYFIKTSDLVNTCYFIFSSSGSPYIQLGFNSGSTNIIEPIGTYSTNSISMYDKFSVYIRSNLIQGQATYKNGRRENILERLNIQAFNSIATYQASPLQNKFHVPDSFSEIDISITTDDPSTYIDLNGLNYQITLMFSFTTDLKGMAPENFAFVPYSEPDFSRNIYPQFASRIQQASEEVPTTEEENELQTPEDNQSENIASS